MTIQTISSRQFTRDVSAAKKAAVAGPVFITDRGKPRYVLQTIENYYAREGVALPSFLEVMDAIPGGEGIAFDAPRLDIGIRDVDFFSEDD